MLSNYAILIDGAFLQHQLASKDAPMTAIAVRRLVGRLSGHEHLAGRELHRVYYYDAEAWGGVEEKPLGGGKIDFSAHPVKARNDALRKEIRRIPDVALRMGKTRFDGWELRQRILKKSGDKAEIQADDLRPKIRQKGVDMRIGLDIASLTLKRQARIIVLVALRVERDGKKSSVLIQVKTTAELWKEERKNGTTSTGYTWGFPKESPADFFAFVAADKDKRDEREPIWLFEHAKVYENSSWFTIYTHEGSRGKWNIKNSEQYLLERRVRELFSPRK